MANAVNGNTIYIDTGASSVTDSKNVVLKSVVLTGTGGHATLVLQNNNPDVKVNKLVVKTANDTTLQLRFDEAPISFPDGIYVLTATNCQATLVLTRTGAS